MYTRPPRSATFSPPRIHLPLGQDHLKPNSQTPEWQFPASPPSKRRGSQSPREQRTVPSVCSPNIHAQTPTPVSSCPSLQGTAARLRRSTRVWVFEILRSARAAKTHFDQKFTLQCGLNSLDMQLCGRTWDSIMYRVCVYGM